MPSIQPETVGGLILPVDVSFASWTWPCHRHPHWGFLAIHNQHAQSPKPWATGGVLSAFSQHAMHSVYAAHLTLEEGKAKIPLQDDCPEGSLTSSYSTQLNIFMDLMVIRTTKALHTSQTPGRAAKTDSNCSSRSLAEPWILRSRWM